MLVSIAGAGEAAESYSDDFVGTVLRPEWRIENQDPNRFGLTEGNYLLLVSNLAEKNILSKSIDGSGDFTIELVGHGSFTLSPRPLLQEWRRGSCIIFGVMFSKQSAMFSEQNRINIAVCTNFLAFNKKVSGKFNVINRANEQFSRFVLRIEKRGAQYLGITVLDGKEIDLGSHFMPQPPSAIFIKASNFDETVPEAGILIDRVSITPN
jgi:hypothetical protein